ncbi:Gfo/Idh/MocA family oxidoreductase [Chloroflexi bacterium TSY]|nr:Gfo/Idh/MocA family oxidoreductase [Chloroflexi bacterium TSY]
MYKCAIVAVSGGRARGHAEAYQHIKRGQLAAISTRTRENLDAFGDQYGVAARYTDYKEMFEKEKPDLVHVNTPPDVRLEVFQAAEEIGIPSVIVEKPLAIQGEDFMAIQEFAKTSSVKIAINHQLHFHPRRMAMQKIVQDGGIGEVRFIDASARMNLAYQGTHTLQAINAFNPTGKPTSIMGQVSGVTGLAETPRQHFAPDQCVGLLTFDNGISASLRCGANAPFVLPGDERTNVHKRVGVYGTRGYIHWTMWSWEIGQDGKIEAGEHTYGDEDILGQAAMTEAMFDWMEDEKAIHPLNLDLALQDFNIVLKTYMSALHHRMETLDSAPDARLIAALRTRLG